MSVIAIVSNHLESGDEIARKVAEGQDELPGVTASNLEDFLGVKKFRYGLAEKEDQIGVVTGLAWTQVGGELLLTEVTLMRGKGQLTLTGQLGDVMQESARAALSFVRSRAEVLGIDTEVFEKTDVHVHVPEGAIPKDGPSAGIAMCTTIASILSGKKIRSDFAMTGEVSLTGVVMPIGGLKEKLIAAHKAGMKEVLIPQKNYERDLDDIPDEVKEALVITPVSRIEEVIEKMLV